MLNFKEKSIALRELAGTDHFDSDLTLVTKLDPSNPIIKTNHLNKEKAQKEILWVLLDLASRDEIRTNRRNLVAETEAVKKAAEIAIKKVAEMKVAKKNNVDAKPVESEIIEKVEQAQSTAEDAQSTAEDAQETAYEAKEIAEQAHKKASEALEEQKKIPVSSAWSKKKKNIPK